MYAQLESAKAMYRESLFLEFATMQEIRFRHLILVKLMGEKENEY